MFKILYKKHWEFKNFAKANSVDQLETMLIESLSGSMKKWSRLQVQLTEEKNEKYLPFVTIHSILNYVVFWNNKNPKVIDVRYICSQWVIDILEKEKSEEIPDPDPKYNLNFKYVLKKIY